MRTARSCAPALLALATLMAGCAAFRGAAESPSLDGTAWVLAALPGRTLLANASPTLRFEKGQVGGSDGCNHFGGGYTAADTALAISPQLAMTMMACPDDVSQQAQAFLSALQGTRAFRIAEGRLELLSADGSTRAALTAQSQGLPGSAWEVTGLNDGRQAVVSLLAGTRITLAFGPDGGASGSAGCNRFSARFESDGSRLHFSPAAATRRMCAEPAGVMEQEQQFLAALASVETARFEGERLTLRTADGALALTLVRSEHGGEP